MPPPGNSNAPAFGPRASCARPKARLAFTLIELLVVIGIIAVLAAIFLPALSRARESARAVQCLSQTRQLGLAVRCYADENDSTFPRSQHSAFAHGQLPWERSLAPQLGSSVTAWTNLLAGVYHCPTDKRPASSNYLATLSYGLNVYVELGPDDDYVGKPQTWRRTSNIPRPSATILFAEVDSAADHIMPHFWVTFADTADIASKRHLARANYTFADGHSEARKFETTWQPGGQIDVWNPALAR